MKYSNKFNIFSPHQFDFRSGHSTDLALIAQMDDSKKAIDEGKFAASIFLYLSKAFDTIMHCNSFR